MPRSTRIHKESSLHFCVCRPFSLDRKLALFLNVPFPIVLIPPCSKNSKDFFFKKEMSFCGAHLIYFSPVLFFLAAAAHVI